ncbi:hypothetical protein ACFOU0_00205 [Salinicoccus sesuvii]|uniref:Bacterial Pleckstrin homology domain-containing protein n=1 Tax=Salinicoccus sesuvii TaxID=868281 RepID=A0ABV7N0C3_9STAP
METIIFFVTTFAIVIQAFYLHFFSSSRRYFSFDDANFTEQELLQLEDSWVVIFERFSIFMIFGLFIFAVIHHLYIDPVNSVWFIISIYIIMFLMLAINNCKVYRMTHRRKHLWHSIWPILLIPVTLYMMLSLSIDKVEVTFEGDGAMISGEMWKTHYSDIDQIEMVQELPPLPVDNRMSGIGPHIHGDFLKDDKGYTFHIEDRSNKMIRLAIHDRYIYFNSSDETVTSQWYSELVAHME